MLIDAIARDTGEVLAVGHNGLVLPVMQTRVSLELPENFTFDQWSAIGITLKSVEGSIMWWIGDWWAFGAAHYGQRKEIVESEEWDGPTFETCKNAASVCRAFERSRRRDLLSFKHHAEVAARAPDEADALLDWVEETIASTGKPRSTRDLRTEVNRRRAARTIGASGIVEECTIQDLFRLAQQGKKFGTIYADPPWQYDNQGTRAATGNHYSGMSVDELCALPVGMLAADASHLHLWTTNGFLFECPRILDAWGFEFKSTFVWAKPDIGIGNYWRNAHEIMLTAVRGDAKRFNDHGIRSWLECRRGEHSEKPEQVRTFIERASPGPYLELFGRKAVKGWAVWGNQIERNMFTQHIKDVA